MINIVLFGKPRAFESHEYAFDVDNATSVDNSFPEPILKPKKFREWVLHYFSGNGYSGIECYTRAKGYESDRDGIVFGIAIKSDHDFELTTIVDKLLKPYWSEFESVLLDSEDRFVCPSIHEVSNGTTWGDEDVTIIRKSVNDLLHNNPNKKLCLLFAPEYEKISTVESQIKDYSDVYISANIDIFKDPINKVVLNLTGGKIHTIKDGAIVEYKEGKKTSVSVQRKRLPQWGPVTRDQDEIDVNNDTGTGHSIDYYDETGDGGGKGVGIRINGKVLIALLAAVVAIIVVVIILARQPVDSGNSGGENPKTEVRGTQGGGNNTPAEETVNVTFESYDKPINEHYYVIPTLSKPENSSIVSSDIEYNVDHTDIVKLEKENDTKYKLIVVKKPTKEMTVTVTAMYNGETVGSQDYKIAKKKNGANQTLPQDPKIRFGNYPPGHTFTMGEKTEAKATSKGQLIEGGEWFFEDDGIGYNSGTEHKNPIVIWPLRTGTHIIKYKYNGKEVATATLICR